MTRKAKAKRLAFVLCRLNGQHAWGWRNRIRADYRMVCIDCGHTAVWTAGGELDHPQGFATDLRRKRRAEEQNDDTTTS